AYAAEGARVVVADVEAETAKALVASLGDRAHFVHLDVRSQDSITRAVDEAAERFGTIDILVNNAGVFDMAPLDEITADMYRRQFDVNVGGLIFVTQAVAAKMREKGNGGAVIN